jgi:hypothetical protein
MCEGSFSPAASSKLVGHGAAFQQDAPVASQRSWVGGRTDDFLLKTAYGIGADPARVPRLDLGIAGGHEGADNWLRRAQHRFGGNRRQHSMERGIPAAGL